MANSRTSRFALVILSCSLLAGCIGEALIYSRTTRPLMTDFDATPVAGDSSKGRVETVSFYVDIKWGDAGIGEIARQEGIAEIYYADIQTITVLRYWRQDYVRVYGRPVAPGEAVDPGPANPPDSGPPL